jgi:VWFA-related protein
MSRLRFHSLAGMICALLVGALALLGLCTAVAESGPQQDASANNAQTHKDDSETTLSVQVNVVNVFATVRDKKGKVVGDLTKDDLTLSEDGRPQDIHYFTQDTNLPLTLGLLVDTSLSQRRVLDQERNASRTFLDQMVREDKDKAFILHFDREVELLQDLTASHQKLEDALASLTTPQPGQSSGGNSPDTEPNQGRGARLGRARSQRRRNPAL